MSDEEKIDRAMMAIRDEVLRAHRQHGAFHSAHEGWGVIDEEFAELKEAIQKHDRHGAAAEAVQLGAMAVLFLVSFTPISHSPAQLLQAIRAPRPALTEPSILKEVVI